MQTQRCTLQALGVGGPRAARMRGMLAFPWDALPPHTEAGTPPRAEQGKDRAPTLFGFRLAGAGPPCI